MPKQGRLLASGILVAVLGGLGIAPASAAEDNSLERLLMKVAPEVRKDLAGAGTPNLGLRTQSGSAIVPETTDEPVTTKSRGEHVSIRLPKAKRTASAKVAGTNVRVFDHSDGSVTVPLAKNDGSVQILTVISSAAAPTDYTYALEVPPGATASLKDDGTVHITAREGVLIGGIAPAWAKDATGKSVPTRYQIDGDKLTQVVDHHQANLTYPVVADPWLGRDLYNSPYVTYDAQGYVINVTPRPWGLAWTGISTWWAHRDEVVSKLGGDRWRWSDSIQEQFYCHIAGVPASLPEYNLESWRPVVSWAESLTRYRCNPYDGAWSR